MTKKVVALPARLEPKRSQPTIEENARVTISVGGERFAIDIRGALTEINPVDAEILSIQKPRRKGKNHARKSG